MGLHSGFQHSPAAGASEPRTVVSYPVLRAILLVAAGVLSFAAGPAVAAAEPTAAGPAAIARPSPVVTAMTAGYAHTCALTNQGGVKCWGDNELGQLGNGTTTDTMTPLDVVGLSSGVVAIAAGQTHTCALMAAGGVKCWGNNYNGQLGNGTKVNSSVPVDVAGLADGAVAIIAGFYNTCAITSAGSVECWGLSWGYSPSSTAPLPVAGLPGGIAAVAAGTIHNCALTSTGGAKCWGRNEKGQLGNGTTIDETFPTAVTGLTSGASAIAAGDRHSCAVTGIGSVECWGSNIFGQLGDGSTVDRLAPVAAAGLVGAVAVVAGSRHTCALTAEGGVDCWGQNAYGQLGSGGGSSLTPVGVAGLAFGVRSISAGDRHTCAVTVGGGAKCWGANTRGQLGNGSRRNSKVPVDVDFATHQAIDLRSSKPSGSLHAGTTVTFTATVVPLGVRTVVRFEIYRQIDGVWRRSTHRDVTVDSNGRATLRWTFATTGSRRVRAQALENSTYAASIWSPPIYYVVR